MPAIPHSVLSDQLKERIRGRQLVAAVFLTFRFDPAFFEQDALPLFFDIPLSHAPGLKLVQLEDAMRSVPHGVAVYYDRNGIIPGAGAGRLDIKRIPVCHRTGIFHPKNVFALVEEVDANEEGHRPQALIVATMSANLSRSGWWENVEVCHVEEIGENESTRLRDDLIHFLADLGRKTEAKASEDGNAALHAIREFLRMETDFRLQRSSGGILHTHFFDGRTEVADFIESVAGRSLREMNLEIISPYFDDNFNTLPIHKLIERFQPQETRIFLPRNESSDALCSKGVFEGVRKMEGVTWARLPADIMRSGKAKEACDRFVHAKVYRFFQSTPRREVLFIGSVNLTSPAHRRGGNLETAFIVDVAPAQKPEWWLIPDSAHPGNCISKPEDEGAATGGGTNLSLRFWWDTGRGEAFWDSSTPSPALTVKWQDTTLFTLASLPPNKWTPLSMAAASELHRVLQSTSLLTVACVDMEPALLLAQEEGMHARPSLLFDLSPAEILRYWSLLTPAQRAEFLTVRIPDLMKLDGGEALCIKFVRLVPDETFFDRFAGIFLAFGNLERTVRQALPGNEREATYRLFGKKYDSLPNLLDKVMESAAQKQGDPIESYVTFLCARQLVTSLKPGHSEFFQKHLKEARGLEEQLQRISILRARLIESDPTKMPDFLDWFENWFVRRAKPVEAVEA